AAWPSCSILAHRLRLEPAGHDMSLRFAAWNRPVVTDAQRAGTKADWLGGAVPQLVSDAYRLGGAVPQLVSGAYRLGGAVPQLVSDAYRLGGAVAQLAGAFRLLELFGASRRKGSRESRHVQVPLPSQMLPLALPCGRVPGGVDRRVPAPPPSLDRIRLLARRARFVNRAPGEHFRRRGPFLLGVRPFLRTASRARALTPMAVDRARRGGRLPVDRRDDPRAVRDRPLPVDLFPGLRSGGRDSRDDLGRGGA